MTPNYCPRCLQSMGNQIDMEHGVCPTAGKRDNETPNEWLARARAARSAAVARAYPWEHDAGDPWPCGRPVDWARDQRNRAAVGVPAAEWMAVRRDDYGPALTPAGVRRAVWRGRLVAVWNLVRSNAGWFLAWAMLTTALGWLAQTALQVWRMGR